MTILKNTFKRNIFYLGTIFFVVVLIWFYWSIQPASNLADATKNFEITKGEGAIRISERLASEGLIRSSISFDALLLLSGSAYRLKPGFYSLPADASSFEIINTLVAGPEDEISVSIPEGASLYDIDKILSESNILPKGALIDYANNRNLEGMLFPDTYRFYAGSSVPNVADKFLKNFDDKIASLEPDKKSISSSTLITASLLEKEVPELVDRKIVAGIILKRLKVGMPLQIDATICYIKRKLSPKTDVGCYPLSAIDFTIDSPYNTYLYRGWPPGPIGSPGILALQAALAPQSSPYWYYLSDPVTGKTIFSKTLDEQSRNRALYLSK